jgi:hypothetical protein
VAEARPAVNRSQCHGPDALIVLGCLAPMRRTGALGAILRGLPLAVEAIMDTTTPVEPAPLPYSFPLSQATERRLSSRVSWGAIFAGSAVSVGIWIMLHLLGLGIGLTAIDPDNVGSLKGVGIASGIGSLIAPIISLFLGGLVTGRLLGVFDRQLGSIHGAVVWALTTVVGVALLVSAIGSVVGGAARMAGRTIEQTASAVVSGAGTLDRGTLDALGLSGSDLVAPINRQLREQGKPEVTPAQLEAATRDVIRDAVRTGELDRTTLERSVADHTALSRTDAASVATQIEERWSSAKQRIGAQAEQAKVQALEAAEATGKGMLVAFLSMLLGLVAAIGGAVLGASWVRRQVVRSQRPRDVPTGRGTTVGLG